MTPRSLSSGRLAHDGAAGDAWRALQFGGLWGVATTAMESMATPLGVVATDRWMFIVALLPYWCAKSILVAYVALRVERRFSGLPLAAIALSVLLLISGSSMVWITVVDPHSQLWAFRRQPLAVFCYDLWSGMFYGGLLLLGCIVTSRAARMSRLLNQAEIDRGLTEALVAEIRLKELQGSVNTEVLYDALAEVMRRYVAGLSSADRLLDCLVSFLRTAMPSLRETTSTVAAELELTRIYLRLRVELYPRRGAWQVEAADDVGPLMFPPLQLIDMLDRFTRSPEGESGGVMAITRCEGGARVELRAAPQANDALAPGAASRPATKVFEFVNPAYLPGAA